MILSNNSSYDYLQNYFEGYIDGISLLANKNIRLEITEWFQEKAGQKTNFYFTNQIKHFNKSKSDTELQNELIETIRNFFLEHPSYFTPSNQSSAGS